MSKDNQVLEELTSKEYEHGWTINIETDSAPKGLNEGIIRFISAKKNEPQWLLDWRLDAFRQWMKMTEPKWP
ncbi:MAG: Fe-S cluster assembly protein SufB, partial [Bacteroidota bacterium]